MHNLTKDEVLKELNTNLQTGLTDEQVNQKLQNEGYNELQEGKKKSIIVKFFEEFADILIIILLIAAVVSVIVDPEEWVESVIILVVVLVNAILGVAQEARAEKSLEALKKMSSPNAKVLRNGKYISIPSREVVKGDIILIEQGDFIPCDGRILESSSLKVDESSLTGESVSVEKYSDVIEGEVSLGDMKNMVFSSTYATYGKATIVCTATGMNTEIGKIAKMLTEKKETLTPLQEKLNQIGGVIGLLAIGICAVVFILEMIATGDWIESFKTAIALAVAAIPEGLATVVTVILAIGVQKMVKNNAIVKKLPAVETLGCTSVVCSDKTGTLTINKMTTVKVVDTDFKVFDVEEELSESAKFVLDLFAVCSDAKITLKDGKEIELGDPTEVALIRSSNLYGDEKQNRDNVYKRLADFPFDSDRKMMSVIVEHNGKKYVYTKGAIDVITKKSINITNPEIVDSINLDLASNGLRVLALAYKEIDDVTDNIELVESNLNLIGLVGMIDPARDEVKGAIALAKKAGIRTVMITGDHVVTAKAIAKDLGILLEGDLAVSTHDLNKMTDEELDSKIKKISVYARVTPEDKVRVVEAWQRQGKIVAMTGDGVNDSPSLKKADIGCAMGITGTDVSKQAASLILVDDNFNTIITAVKEGRGIYENIKKTVRYLLSSNIGEVITIFVASLIAAFFPKLALGIPLLSIHLLWINLITDSLPAFGLGMEATEDDVMDNKPRDKKESFFANGLGKTIVIEGLFIGSLTLITYLIGHSHDTLLANGGEITTHFGQTMAFITLSTLQLVHSFNVKSKHSIFSKKTFNNKFLIFAALLGLVLQFTLMFVPALRGIFKLELLSLPQLLITLGISFSIVFIVEAEKLIERLVKKNK